MENLEFLIKSERHLISLEKLRQLSKEDFCQFCTKRYQKPHSFNINENFGKRQSGSFSAIHAAGWLNNIEALKILISLGADIHKKSDNNSTVLDSFIDSIREPSSKDVTKNLNNIIDCIDILKEKNFDFNKEGYDSYQGLYYFLKKLERHEELSQFPESSIIIKKLIANTNLNSTNIMDNHGINALSALAYTVNYFNPEMIDLAIAKNELTKQDMQEALMILPRIDKNDWNKMRNGFYHFIREAKLELDNTDQSPVLIQKCIEYRHKPLFQIATYNSNQNLNCQEILENSIRYGFKYGITYIKKYNMELLLNNKELISLAPDEKTTKYLQEQMIIAQHQFLSKNLNSTEENPKQEKQKHKI